ncbi:steroid 17-alpha-hydroxylase/17,20 lyase-like [Diadema antillarum]|uniref:steroid 17-alpha-hydroxylase/17,20 lyase-like n=1 Tax=Diadema antillarum TaxID=105358 RepID=UPI003A83C4B0
MKDILGMFFSVGQINSLTITAAIGLVTLTLAYWSVKRPHRFPPGPRGLPIVGSIFGMIDSPQIIFGQWAKIYGNIFGFKVGERWMVVLNGQKAIKDAVIKQGVDFAGRPDFHSVEIFTEGFKDIAFSSFSETWKLHRKLAHTALRHFATGEPLQNLISSMYPKLKKALSENGSKPINPKILLNLLLYNILSQMCFGKKYELNDPNVTGWMKINEEINEGFGLGLAADFFSWAKYLPTSGPKLLRDTVATFFVFLKEQLSGLDKTYDPENIDNFYHLMLKAQDDARKEGENVEKLTDTHVFQTIADIFGAGTTTSVETLYWAIALLTELPDIQRKVQEEIDAVIGRKRVPTIEDRGTLPYTEATLYEIMRYSSIAPIAVPHATTKDTELHGYIIPKGAVVMINTYSMHFDPQEWDDPDSFKPEHFLDDSGTVRQHPPSFMPFGAGRRSCLGEAVAKADLFLIFSWFLQNYTFSKVPGKESESLLNMIPKTATGRLLTPYEVIITPRPIEE